MCTQNIAGNSYPSCFVCYYKTSKCIFILAYAVFVLFQIRNSRGRTAHLFYDISPKKDKIIQNFYEKSSIPSDAEKVDETWEYVNKDGSPDRRFNNNRRISIMKYCEIEIESNDDFYLELLTSNYKIGKSFANALKRYKNL